MSTVVLLTCVVIFSLFVVVVFSLLVFVAQPNILFDGPQWKRRQMVQEDPGSVEKNLSKAPKSWPIGAQSPLGPLLCNSEANH